MNKEERKKLFDYKLKELLKIKRNYDDSSFGYTISNKNYELYLSNAKWEMFKKEMKELYPRAYDQYDSGNGGELNIRFRNDVKMPPKMASIASSSRFVYLTFRDNHFEKLTKIVKDIKCGGEFKFEHKLHIKKVGSEPNLDAAYIENNKSVYIEAKCHELFDNNSLTWKEAYFKYGLLTGAYDYSLGIDESLIRNRSESNFKYNTYTLKKETFGLKERDSLYLDLKQFVCHLLGIANTNHKQKELIYLYFKPQSLTQFNEEYKILEEQFKTFCESKYIEKFCKKNNISLKLVYAVNDTMECEFIPEIKLEYYY